MKVCPNCQQQYPDDDLNFCLNDGGILTRETDDAPPTVLLNQARTTNQNWGYTEPMSAWQNQPLQQQNPAYLAPPKLRGSDQTLPILSLIFGVLSILFICLFGGMYFGISSMILGYMGFYNANNNPDIYSGKELAIAGMVLGGISFVINFLFIVRIIL